MSRNQNSSEPEPHDGHDRQPAGRDEPNDREPPDGGETIGRAHSPRDDEDDEDDYQGVTSRLPAREDLEDAHEDDRDEDDDDGDGEQELAEADMLEVVDLDDLELMEGPDA